MKSLLSLFSPGDHTQGLECARETHWGGTWGAPQPHTICAVFCFLLFFLKFIWKLKADHFIFSFPNTHEKCTFIPLSQHIHTRTHTHMHTLCISVCLHVCMCTMHTPGAYRGQSGYQVPGLGVKTVVSCCVRVGG